MWKSCKEDVKKTDAHSVGVHMKACEIKELLGLLAKFI